MPVAFSGSLKQIIVYGVSDFSIVNVDKDIYSRWKNWVATGNNSKYLQALRPVGGDSIGGSSVTPSYFFLMNDWKVTVDGAQNVRFQYNLYCDVGTNENTNPFLVTNNGSVVSAVSDAPANTAIGGSGLSPDQSNKLKEIWQDRGLDSTNPKVINATTESVGLITKIRERIGDVLTVTRQ